MESNISQGNMVPGGSGFGGLDLQGSMRVNHHQHPHSLQQPHHCQTRQGLMPNLSGRDVFPLTIGQNVECDKHSVVDHNNGERDKNLPSDEEEHSFDEGGMGGLGELSKGKIVPWQRVKWADSMVKLLITAVSYLGEDALLESGLFGRRKLSAMHKKGKWKLVSKAMAERGFYVSPQQCEDKFNDLNKRYKKLNDILGRGTTCQVVEKPALLDVMDHLSEKIKDEVRKILSSKHLFYEEMCSYHNNNRLHLPHDPALQRSLQLALRSRDDYDTDSRRHPHDDADEDDHDGETDDHEEYEEKHNRGAYMASGDSSKRMKPGLGLEEFNFGNPHSIQDVSKGPQLQSKNPQTDMHLAFPQCQKESWLQKELLKSRSLQLEEQKLQIESEMLELQKQQLKWQRFSKKKDRELEKLKLENDRMRLENERTALELKRMEMTIDCNK